MWIELGKPRPGMVEERVERTWLNMDTVARIEFVEEKNQPLVATVITVKPAGADRSVFRGDDAYRLKNWVEKGAGEWSGQPLLPYEEETFRLQREAAEKAKPKPKRKK